jgi:hypothetical protein
VEEKADQFITAREKWWMKNERFKYLFVILNA